METYEAVVVEAEETVVIEITIDREVVKIPMTEDNAREVKTAFNRLLLQLKRSAFKLELRGEGGDLFSQVAKEYIGQLNKELREVHREMEEYGLLVQHT